MIQGGAKNCYVYYRVQPGQMQPALQAVAALLVDLKSRTGIAGTLSRRIEDPADSAPREGTAPTWMETYAGIPDPQAFTRELEAAALYHGLTRCLPEGAQRTLEWFESMPATDASNTTDTSDNMAA